MNNDPTKKHGMGKGLMTVWRAINPNGGKLPTGIDFTHRPQRPTPVSRKPPRKKGAQQLVSLLVSNLYALMILLDWLASFLKKIEQVLVN